MSLTPTYSILDSCYVCFHPKSLFWQGKDDPIAEKVAKITKQLHASPKVLLGDIKHFLQFTPYSLSPSALIHLLTNPPITLFTTFLKPALLCHPPQVIHSLQHSNNKITAPSFFFLFWVSTTQFNWTLQYVFCFSPLLFSHHQTFQICVFSYLLLHCGPSPTCFWGPGSVLLYLYGRINDYICSQKGDQRSHRFQSKKKCQP